MGINRSQSVQRNAAPRALDRVVTKDNGTSSVIQPVSRFGAEAAATQPKRTVSGSAEDKYQGRLPYAGRFPARAGGTRTGFVLTSDLWLQTNRTLELFAGPNTASWTLPLRAEDEPTKAGHARFAQQRQAHSFDSKSGSASHASHTSATYYDFPSVELSFQAGNVLPIPGTNGDVIVPFGLQDFYSFIELLNQPPLLPVRAEVVLENNIRADVLTQAPGLASTTTSTSDEQEGKHNYVWVYYHSLQLPDVVLKGYFEPGGFTWTDSAEDPANLTWSATLEVFEMSPNLWESIALIDRYHNEMKRV